MKYHPNQFRFGNGAPAWSEQQKLDLLRMHKDKTLTRAEIARRLGKTKNAVIGQLDRLLRQGMPVRRDKPGGKPAGRNEGKPGGNNNPTGWNGTTTRKLAAKLTQPKQPLKPKDSHRSGPHLPKPAPCVPQKSILELGHAQCRYIGERPDLLTLDTLIYCGAPTDGGSWCPEHRMRCVVPLHR